MQKAYNFTKNQKKSTERSLIYVSQLTLEINSSKRNKAAEKTLFCPFENCRSTFTETGNLKTHINGVNHLNQRNYACKECKESFITKGHLNTHMGTHHRETNIFKC